MRECNRWGSATIELEPSDDDAMELRQILANLFFPLAVSVGTEKTPVAKFKSSLFSLPTSRRATLRLLQIQVIIKSMTTSCLKQKTRSRLSCRSLFCWEVAL